MLGVCEMELLPGCSYGRRTVNDDTDALLARGCRSAANTTSSLRANTSGSSLGCLSTGGGAAAGTVKHGVDFARGNEVASIRLKCAPHASAQYTTAQ